MAYVGNTPAAAYTSIAKQDITGDGGTDYTLDHSVANENEIEVFVNNVRQEPSIAYTVAGASLVMGGNVEASDDFYVVFQGKAIQTVTHPSNSALNATSGTFSGDVTADGTAFIGEDISATAPTNSDDLVLSRGGGANVGLSILSANNTAGTVTFGDPDDVDVGFIRYHHANDSMRFNVNATEGMRINSSGSVTFNQGTIGTWKYLSENVAFPTNATYVDVTGIPADAEEVQIIIYECDMADNDQKLQLRIGDSGGLETSGYFGGAQGIGESWRNESSTRWYLVDDNTDAKFSGIIDLASMNGSNRWVMRSIITDPDSSGPTNDIAAGSKQLSASLDRIRLYTQSGNFTDGEYSVRYR